MEWSFQIEGFRFQNFYCVNYWREGAVSRERERGAEADRKRVRRLFGVPARMRKEVNFCDFKNDMGGVCYHQWVEIGEKYF
jgi:hypothetical protein